MFVGTHVGLGVCGGQGWTLTVTPQVLPPSFLRQGLLLTGLELGDSAGRDPLVSVSMVHIIL